MACWGWKLQLGYPLFDENVDMRIFLDQVYWKKESPWDVDLSIMCLLMHRRCNVILILLSSSVTFSKNDETRIHIDTII